MRSSAKLYLDEGLEPRRVFCINEQIEELSNLRWAAPSFADFLEARNRQTVFCFQTELICSFFACPKNEPRNAHQCKFGFSGVHSCFVCKTLLAHSVPALNMFRLLGIHSLGQKQISDGDFGTRSSHCLIGGLELKKNQGISFYIPLGDV